MSDEPEKSRIDWLKLAPDLEYFDPFAGLSGGLVDDEAAQHTRYGFIIAGQNILIEQTVLCEVIQNSYIYPVPNTPAWVSGMINLRGNLIPVFNLGSLLSSDGEYTPAKKLLLIIDRGDRAIAIPIDALPLSLEFEEETAEKTGIASTSELIGQFSLNAFNIEGRVWHELDHEALFKHMVLEISGETTGYKEEAI